MFIVLCQNKLQGKFKDKLTFYLDLSNIFILWLAGFYTDGKVAQNNKVVKWQELFWEPLAVEVKVLFIFPIDIIT